MPKAPGNSNLSNRREKAAGLPDDEKKDNRTIDKTEIKNAQAAGIGALGRSDENQIEKLIDTEPGSDENVY